MVKEDTPSRNLTPSRYRASVEMTGFSKLLSGDIEVASQQSARVDLTLQVEVTFRNR